MKPSLAEQLADLTKEQLVDLVLRQVRIIEDLRSRLAEGDRKSHRQASPFSKNRRKPDPKRPGRRPGEGRFDRKPEPPEKATDIRVQASTPEQCPDCGGSMELERIDSATVVELQKQPEPVVIRYSVPVCRCKDCGRKVRGKAPGLAPDQHGATAHRFGPRVMAMAHLLHYGFGITVRKVPAVLHATTGLSITSSAITQNALKQSEGAVGEAYHKLRNSMRTAPVIYTDDTGWRIGGKNAHLMGFDSDIATVYQIREHHRNEEVREIIPADYAGTMVSDRGKSYDAEALDGTRQQKCVGHIQHNIADVLEAKTGPARTFGLRLKGLFQEALALKKSPPADPENAIEEIEDLQQRLTHQLRDRTLTDDDNQRLLNGLGAQMDRGRLLTFLYIPEVEATNNRAERIIRPAVIARKVSQCSKNERGANAHSAFMSIIQTAYKSVPAAAQKIQNALLALLVGSPETG